MTSVVVSECVCVTLVPYRSGPRHVCWVGDARLSPSPLLWHRHHHLHPRRMTLRHLQPWLALAVVVSGLQQLLWGANMVLSLPPCPFPCPFP